MKLRLFINALLVMTVVMITYGCSSEKKPSGETETVQQTDAKPQNYGRIKEVMVDETINPKMSERGNKIFDVTCSACHKMDERYVGPPLGDVAVRRTPEYIMNMILDTDVMIEHDDTARCLMQEYLTRMPNTNIDESDARDVLEYLRDVAGNR